MSSLEYIIMNKPRGCITACKDERHQTVMEFLPSKWKDLRPVGRLDKDTEGLLLFTNDGQFNQWLMHPDFHMEKTYFFWAMGTLDAEKRRKLEQGVLLKGADTPTAPAKLRIKKAGEITDILPLLNLTQQPGIMKNPRNQKVISGILTITEGKKHQVKRMLKSVGCYVVYLKRLSIGPLSLDTALTPGEARPLSDDEKNLFSYFS